MHYARHFLLLSVLAAALAVTGDWRSSYGPIASFGLYGALHASALTACLRRSASLRHKGMFIAISAALSALVALVSLRAHFSALPGYQGPASVLMLASCLGAVGYASLIRYFWMPDLRLRAIVSIALGCAAADLACLTAELQLGVPSGLGLAAVWWFAFSAGLWCVSRTRASNASSSPVP